jgi:hypothetical protein
MATSDPPTTRSSSLTDPALPVGGTPDKRLQDAWPLVHPDRPTPTFRLFDRQYGPDPIACDFVFVSNALAPRVRRVEVDLQTRAQITSPYSSN